MTPDGLLEVDQHRVIDRGRRPRRDGCPQR